MLEHREHRDDVELWARNTSARERFAEQREHRIALRDGQERIDAHSGVKTITEATEQSGVETTNIQDTRSSWDPVRRSANAPVL
jgi:hypothetical protein